ncbi:hypothetical protein [Rhizobium sp. SGZ-381]|uniref:hypothetical protein n=1 Tax=Rhizobium sp. SGZ-381 TaxID=3342800 RepID=UPI00367295EE
MGPQTRECESNITREGNRRLIALPDDFFLEGQRIIIRQERDGTITIHPAEAAAIEAMSIKFNPFPDWDDDTSAKTTTHG